MKIGEIAEQTGVSRSIIRYYENKGLLPRPVRDRAGYRNYGDAELARIRLVTGVRRMGCTFKEIQEIMAMQDRGDAPPSRILQLLTRKIVEVTAEIGRLKEVQLELLKIQALVASLMAGEVERSQLSSD